MSQDKRQVHTDALATLGTIITDKEKRDAIHLAVIPMMAPLDSGRPLYPGDHVGPNGYVVNKYGTNSNGSVGIVDPFLTEAVKPGQWFWLVIYPRTIKSLRHVWEHPAFPDEDETGPELSDEEVYKIMGAAALERRELINESRKFLDDNKEFLLALKEKYEEKSASETESLEERFKNLVTYGCTHDIYKKPIEESKKWIEDYAISINEEFKDLMDAAKTWVESESGYDYYYGDNNASDRYGMQGKFDGEQSDPEFWHHYEIVTGTKVPEERKQNFFTCSC